MIDLTNRVAIVTGAGAGLGRSYALALAERGAKVVVNDLGAQVDGAGSDSARANAVADEISALGGTAVPEHSSVATPEGGEAIVKRALDAFGQVDILVNNAGNIELSSFPKLDVRAMARVLDVHLGGAFYVTQPAYRAMLPRRCGSIIFTVSGVATFGNLGASVYGAAKGGIIGLFNVLKLEAARHGIRVNAVAPMAQTRLAADVDLEEYKAATRRSISPDLIAPAVVYLASVECELTGEIWSVGSGSVARLFVGRTAGYFKHPDEEGPLTPEEIAEHVAEIQDVNGFDIPETWPEEWTMVLERLRTDS
ncbi:MAG: SDR family NAD(P)-dependent oxidoreductase [Gemmatimonas sp.]|nr:SDR family NAD(P)-dependent oxidoreductase [Gemmatimonas sp.]